MYLNVIVLITIIKAISVDKVSALFLHPNVAEDLSADYENNEKFEPKKDIRKSFLEKKKLNEEQNINVKLLKGLFKPQKKNIIIYYDEIPHYKVYKGSKIHKAMNTLENEFMRLLKMINFKYIFKRDRHWRTWREVKYPNGTKIVFNYKSHNLVDIKPNCTNCVSNTGFWDIEEKPPPCPYEIFSMKTASLLCGITHQELKKGLTGCPVKIKFIDLSSTCSNPVVTKWKFEKLYSNRASKTSSSSMAGARDVFEIITLYRIRDGEIIFQIINSTNEVVYSKIMRPGYLNFVCVEDCGIFNPTTLKITKKDAPLSLDLLNYGHNAKKRENKNGGKKKNGASKIKKRKKYTLTTTTRPFKIIIQCDSYDSDSDSDWISDSDYLVATTRKPKIQKRKKNVKEVHHHETHKTGLKQTTTTPMSMCRRMIAKSIAAETEYDSEIEMDYSY